MATVATWAVVVFAPSQMGDLRGVDGGAEKCVPEGEVGGYVSTRAESKTSFVISAVLETLKQ